MQSRDKLATALSSSTTRIYSGLLNILGYSRQIISAALDNSDSMPKIKILISNEDGTRPRFRKVIVEFHHNGIVEDLNRVWWHRDRNLDHLPDNTLIEFLLPNGRVTSLPEFENKNLLEFFKKFHIENVGYCCGDFVNDIMYGRGVINPTTSDSFLRGEDVITDTTEAEDSLLPGDAVFLWCANPPPRINENGKINIAPGIHYAIHVGGGFYLSVFGYEGPFGISTFQDFQKFYSCTRAEKIYRAFSTDLVPHETNMRNIAVDIDTGHLLYSPRP